MASPNAIYFGTGALKFVPQYFTNLYRVLQPLDPRSYSETQIAKILGGNGTE
jgi:hypothetical protein